MKHQRFQPFPFPININTASFTSIVFSWTLSPDSQFQLHADLTIHSCRTALLSQPFLSSHKAEALVQMLIIMMTDECNIFMSLMNPTWLLLNSLQETVFSIHFFGCTTIFVAFFKIVPLFIYHRWCVSIQGLPCPVSISIPPHTLLTLPPSFSSHEC